MRRVEEEGCLLGAEDAAPKQQNPCGPAVHPWAPASSAPAPSRVVHVFTLSVPENDSWSRGSKATLRRLAHSPWASRTKILSGRGFNHRHVRRGPWHRGSGLPRGGWPRPWGHSGIQTVVSGGAAPHPSHKTPRPWMLWGSRVTSSPLSCRGPAPSLKSLSPPPPPQTTWARRH